MGAAPLPRTGLDEYLDQQERKSLLRFITCGSVDDGKSTLIGRLLFEAKTLFEDQLAALSADVDGVLLIAPELDGGVADVLGTERRAPTPHPPRGRGARADRERELAARAPRLDRRRGGDGSRAVARVPERPIAAEPPHDEALRPERHDVPALHLDGRRCLPEHDAP